MNKFSNNFHYFSITLALILGFSYFWDYLTFNTPHSLIMGIGFLLDGLLTYEAELGRRLKHAFILLHGIRFSGLLSLIVLGVYLLNLEPIRMIQFGEFMDILLALSLMSKRNNNYPPPDFKLESIKLPEFFPAHAFNES